MKNGMSVLFAGGGTGGHLFPGIALAHELQKMHDNIHIIFAVGGKELEEQIISANKYAMKKIGTHSWKRGILGIFWMAAAVSFSFIKAFAFIAKNRIDAVIGLGGYAEAGPLVAACLLRRKIYLLEQNAVPGRANRIFSRFADAVFVQFRSSIEKFKCKDKIRYVGNPVRREIIALRGEAAVNEGFVLLVIGGSQGALALNELFIKSVSMIEFPCNSRIVHISGTVHYERCRELYAEVTVDAELDLAGFKKDMACVYKDVSIAVCRAGATSIAEMTCIGIPLVMIPYPYATEDHQYYNAYEVEERGGGICLKQEDITPEELACVLNGLIKEREKLKEMKNASRDIGMPEAGREISRYIIEAIGV